MGSLGCGIGGGMVGRVGWSYAILVHGRNE